MKKIIIILFCVFGLMGNINAQTKLINRSDLPIKTINFLNKFYPGKDMIYLKEGKYLNIEYEINIEGGTVLEFNRRGELKSIDCGVDDMVSYEIIPREIIEFLILKYGTENIIEYSIEDRDTRYEEHEIEFQNGVEVVFSGRYKNKY